jgi:hypothetical protein
MLNLYVVKVWHTSEPRYFETVEVRTYTAQRAEHLATESYPGCKAQIASKARDLNTSSSLAARSTRRLPSALAAVS